MKTEKDQAELYRHLNPAVDRFKTLDDEDAREAFRGTLVAFVKLYAFLSEVMPFQDPDLEKLYTFGRFLRLKLPTDHSDPLQLDEDVALRYYRLQKISEGRIALTAGEGGSVKPPTAVGTRVAEENAEYLSRIIDILNDRFGTDFTEADQLFFDQVKEELKADAEVVQRAVAKPFDNFSLALRAKTLDHRIDRMDQNQEIVPRYINEQPFQDATFAQLARRAYDEIRERSNDARR